MKSLEREQRAFDKLLNDMLKKHRGEFVVFQGGEPRSYFKDYDSAYRFGLAEYGATKTFLVSRVAEQRPEPVSFSWRSGVKF